MIHTPTTVQDLVDSKDWQGLLIYLETNDFKDPIFDDMLKGHALKNLNKPVQAMTPLGRAAHACIELKKRKTIYPEAKKILGEMGELCNMVQEYSKAKFYLQEAMQFRDNGQLDVAILARFAWALAHLGEFPAVQDALKLAYLASDLANLDRVRMMESAIRVVVGDFVGAITLLNKCEETTKVQGDMIHILGALGQFDIIREILQKMDLQHFNKCNLISNPADINNLPPEVFIGNDQGMGDSLCLQPWVEKLPCKVIWQVMPSQIDLLNATRPANVEYVTEPNLELPWFASGIMQYVAGIQEITPQPPIGTVLLNPEGPIGICTRGNPMQASDYKRSLPPREEFYLLKRLREKYKGVQIKDLTYGEHFKPKDWMETLVEASKCRFVISVDTGIANLCGAYGIPVRTLVRSSFDWRYAGKKPYWESQSVYFQKEYGNWKDVIDEALNYGTK